MKSYLSRIFLAIMLPIVAICATGARAKSISSIGFSAPDTGPAAAAAMLAEVGRRDRARRDQQCRRRARKAVEMSGPTIAAILPRPLTSPISSPRRRYRDHRRPLQLGDAATMPIIAEANFDGRGRGDQSQNYRIVRSWRQRVDVPINPSDQDMMVALGRYLKGETKIKRVAVVGEDTDLAEAVPALSPRLPRPTACRLSRPISIRRISPISPAS